MPRLYCPQPLQHGPLVLPAGAARHVQVLRLQPGHAVTLFDGRGGEWDARIERMGRSEVAVHVDAHRAVEREPAAQVQLAVGIPANERMDWLVEKAAELGAAAIWPLVTERSVLRLSGERAQRKQEHWQAIAAAACEQCGGNRVPVVHPIMELAAWSAPPGASLRLLSTVAGAAPLQAAGGDPLVLLSGPEGGLTPREEQRALAAGFQAASLGPRVLRAETAAVAALAAITLSTQPVRAAA